MTQLRITDLSEEQYERIVEKASQMFELSIQNTSSVGDELYTIVVKGCTQQLYVIANFAEGLK